MKTPRLFPRYLACTLPGAFLFLTPALSTPARAQAVPTPRVADTPAEKKEKDVVELSPFEVKTEKDSGYFAENTLAGSRLNTNLADIAASITVVTKQQMNDTASLDINDVFRYEANTEGSGSYTPAGPGAQNRNQLQDIIGGSTFGNDGTTTTNAQANRVRGLTAPDAAINYFPTNSRIPFDAYNTESVEISRGPNSLLFGLGTPAGIVNQTAAHAALNRDTSEVQLRTDQYGTFRTSLAVNRSLLRDKLAFYGAFLLNKQEFQRKPSSDLTQRQYAAITYKPFKNTVIRGFAEGFREHANRPNSLTPRDFVTPWLDAGRPAYDPITRSITIQSTGQVIGPYVFDALSPGRNPAVAVGTAGLTTPTSPYFVSGITFTGASNRPIELINGASMFATFATIQGFYPPVQTNPVTATPTAVTSGWVPQDPRYTIFDRNWASSNNPPSPTTVINGKTYTYGSWNWRSVTNKSIYDWTKYNTVQQNFSYLRAGNYNLEAEQQILPNLFFSAGWLRQDVDSSENNSVGQLGAPTLQIDPNVNLPDGRANPYFGKPFVSASGTDTFFHPELDDNYRAMLAYDLDLTQHGNFLKYFGHHRFLGMWQEQDAIQKVERWRLSFTTGDADGTLRVVPNLAPPGASLWNGTTVNQWYYMASPGSPQAKVTSGSGSYGNRGWNSPYSLPVSFYNYSTGQFQNDQLTEQINFADNGSYTLQREVKSSNFAVQSNLLGDRLITTLGWRHDDYRARKTTGGQITRVDGTVVAPALAAADIYHYGNGQADYNLIMNRWGRWDKLSGQTKTLGGALRPFKDWSVTRNLGGGSELSEFVQGLTFYLNRSDNFNPPGNYQTDYFNRSLPKPTGKDKELGIGFSALHNKLVARINWFTTDNQNERTGAASTLLTRLVYGDTTLMVPWAKAVVRLRHGANTSVTTWNSEATNPIDTNPTLTSEVWSMLQLPVNYYTGLSSGATQDSQSKGYEVQLTYNPTPNWTMKVTGARQAVIYSHIAPQYDVWLAKRMPVWLAATAPEIADFTDSNGTNYSLKNFWNGYGYSSAALNPDISGFNNTSSQNYFNNNVVSQVAASKALEGAVAPDQRKYHASVLSNYRFGEGRLKGFSIGGSLRWESQAAIGFFGKVGDPTAPLNINAIDVTRPVYDKGNYYADVWFGYSRKIYGDKIGLKIQLNINNVNESGRLEPLTVNFDGSPWGYRIVDPRQFVLTTTFSM